MKNSLVRYCLGSAASQSSLQRIRSLISWLLIIPILGNPVAFGQKSVSKILNPNESAVSRSADIYDPRTGQFSAIADQMVSTRQKHAAAILPDGRVLIAGGYNNRFLNTAELFDPATGKFSINLQTIYNTATGETTIKQGNIFKPFASGAVATLPSGKLLLVGGYDGTSFLSTAVIYDPFSGQFNLTSGSMTAARQEAAATVLKDKTVLVTGGFSGAILDSTEIYDSSSGAFKDAPGMESTRYRHTSTLLADGRVLVAGGISGDFGDAANTYLSLAELFYPINWSEGNAAQFTNTGSMITARAGHTATLLADGKVLIVGGTDGSFVLNTAELYDPSKEEFVSVGSMAVPRVGHTAVRLASGTVLIAGGSSDEKYLNSAEIYDPSTRKFTLLSSTMSVPRSDHQATLLKDGRVLLTGGQSSPLIRFDINEDVSDNVAPSLYITPDSKIGFAPYAASGVVLAFSPQTGTEIKRIVTGGYPQFITPLAGGKTLLVVSVWDNKIFLIDTVTLSLKATYSFAQAEFGYGSLLTLSPDGGKGYISSTGTGEVIKFDIGTGAELGRLKSLMGPAQITVTPDGGTLLIVDTTNEVLVFADASSMAVKHKFDPQTLGDDSDTFDNTTADFTISDKAVLNKDGSQGIIVSQDIATGNNAFIFETSTGKVLNLEAIGSSPAYTALTPDGEYWLVLCANFLSVIPTADPDSVKNVKLAQGGTLGLMNLVFSLEGKHIFYGSAEADVVCQQEVPSGAVIGQTLVGDGAVIGQTQIDGKENVSPDQPSTVAFTPDGKILMALSFASNEITMLTDRYQADLTTFVSEREKFTGINIINLSNETANLTFLARTVAGSIIDETDFIANPVYMQLGPNAQLSAEISQIFNFDSTTGNKGWISLTSDQPIAAYGTVGRIRVTNLDSYVDRLQSVMMNRDQMHDVILPEVTLDYGTSVELDLLNSNYNPSDYDLYRYGPDGTVIEKSKDNSTGGLNLKVSQISDLVTSSYIFKVLLAGGIDDQNADLASGATFDWVGESFAGLETRMYSARHDHTATRLLSGKVLLAGGLNSRGLLDEADIYDPANSKFSSFEIFDLSKQAFENKPIPMKEARHHHTATLLNNGWVLVAGGLNSVSTSDTAELFDPATYSFSFTTGNMTSPRSSHTSSLLDSGEVLIAGGIDGNSYTNKTELYDPISSQFRSTGAMVTPRAFHTATRLNNGQILIVGGYNGSYLDSAELYDPTTGTFTPTGSMSTPRIKHTATLLRDGTVLIVGGMDASDFLYSAEIYYPKMGVFLATTGNMSQRRSSHAAVMLDNGKVLIAGGDDGISNQKDPNNNNFYLFYDDAGDNKDNTDDPWDDVISENTAELFDPLDGIFSLTTQGMSPRRSGHTATLLNKGEPGYLRVLSGVGLRPMEFFDQSVNQSDNAAASLNGIDVNKYVGISTVYSPQFITQPGYRTVLNLINANPENSAVVTITLHGPDGKILGRPVKRLFPIGAQLKEDILSIFANDSSIDNQTGWVEVTSSVDRIVGTVSFVDPALRFLATFELSGIPSKQMLFPMAASNSQYQTSVTLLNAGSQPANVQLELWGPEGNLDRATVVTLPPGSRVARNLGEYFPGMTDRMIGNIRIRSDQPLHSLSLISDPNLKFICAVPPVFLPAP
jgi:hypothetical protein